MTEQNVISLFSEEEKRNAFRQKKLMLIIWFTALAAVLALVITLMVLNIIKINNGYDRSSKGWMTAVSTVVAALFTIGSLFFFAIKFRLTRKYCRMLKDMEKGLKDTAVVRFMRYEQDIVSKDGVFFYTMVVDAKPLRREDISERKVLIESTIEPPELSEGQKLKVTTHANILMSYILMN